jgi:dipeptidyl aminopeptidase/acylaminoacyl peptidase
MKNHVQAILFVLLALSCAQLRSQSSGDGKPAVAYSYKGILYLTTESGRPLKAVKTKLSIGEFTVSPDERFVVFSPPRDPEVTGGPLWLLTIATGALERLPPDPFYNDTHGKKQIEFYADPEFSPTGESVVFVVHGRRTGDLVQTKGPVALIDLETHKVRILKDSLGSDGLPLGFASDLHWSPDGKRILLNYEGNSSITDVDGTKLTDLVIPETEVSRSSLSYGMHALNWLGSRCVLYQAGDDPERDPTRVLNLSTGKTTGAAKVLNLPEQPLRGVLAFSGQLWVRRYASRYRVDGPSISWLVPGDSATTHVRILRRSNEDSIPAGCK